MAPLVSAKAKLARADEHLSALDSELHIWWKPHSQIQSVHVRRDGDWELVVVDPPPQEPPSSLSLLCGDIVTNLRASLDHAVSELVRESGNAPTRATAFPIIYSEKEWCRRIVSPDKAKDSPLWGIDSKGEAWAIIREAQPYYGRDVQSHRLTILNFLVTRDKHDALLVHMAFPAPEAIDSLISWNPDAILLEKRTSPTEPLTFGQRAELLRLRFDSQGPSANVQVVGRLPIDPTFGDESRQATLGGLRQIRNEVAELLSKLTN